MSDLMVQIGEEATAQDVFLSVEKVAPYLAQIRAAIDAAPVQDVTTKKGRDAIASLAHKVSRSKTYLDGEGKKAVDRLKDLPKKIDATRKHVRDTLDAWRDEVRQPLDQWEEKEAARVAGHKAIIEKIHEVASPATIMDASAATLAELLESVNGLDLSGLEEFADEANAALQRSRERLTQQIAIAEQRERDQAELEKLRADQAELQRLRDEQAAREAAKTVTPEPETATPEPAAVAQEPAQVTQLPASMTGLTVDGREAATNRAAMQAFIAGGLDEAAAKRAVALIVKGAIPAVRIEYR